MIHPGLVFLIGVLALALGTWKGRLPLPLGLILFAVVMALLSGNGLPFRHLVEGGFGYLNLILALFAGAFFGQAMRLSGATEALAARLVGALGQKRILVLIAAAILLFLAGMFVGVAGVAVLATGVFVPPMLRRVGMDDIRIAAFIAVLATCGMIAPPVNVPAMSIADGVNMPFSGFDRVLYVLSVIPAVFTVLLFALTGRHAVATAGPAPTAGPAGTTAPADPTTRRAMITALAGLVITLGYWAVLRLFPTVIYDPAVPLVLVIGGLAAFPALGRANMREVLRSSFSGTPLVLAAVLLTVGIAVQIMTLTGVRGWLVISAMSLPHSGVFVELLAMPVFGSILTSMGAANVLGVPFAFSLIHQDMIINVGAISAVAALSEFMPPTAIATALACYVVRDVSIFRVLKHCILPALVIFVTAALVLIFASDLTSLMTGGVNTFQH